MKIQRAFVLPFTFAAHFIFISAFFVTSQTAQAAYLAVAETAELLRPGDYRIGVAPQLLLTSGNSLNTAAYFDLSINPSTNSRLMIGGGDTDFWMSGAAKWVPFPDDGRQPAIGFKGSLIYAREASVNFYNFQVAPIISKIVNTEIGKLNPYVALPVTLIYTDNKKASTSAVQFAVGTEWVDRKDFQAGGELGLNLSNSNSAMTLFFSFPFNSKEGFRK
jgi:hypothetical protein